MMTPTAQIIHQIVAHPNHHAKWLNTLSMMENAGARKISASENPDTVNLIILKHANEEHRHAYYLKKQISKLYDAGFETYQSQYLLAPKISKYYLHTLDIEACRYIKKHFGLSGEELKYAAYLFVTYAIEVRADELYPIYQDELDATQSKVMVKSIIVEEEGHLEEMIKQLETFDTNWEHHANAIVAIEQRLFDIWMQHVAKEIA